MGLKGLRGDIFLLEMVEVEERKKLNLGVNRFTSSLYVRIPIHNGADNMDPLSPTGYLLSGPQQ